MTSSCGKIGPAQWASPVHPELGPGWAIKLLARKNQAKFGPVQYGPTRPDLPEFFLPSKDYLAQPAWFLGRARAWAAKILAQKNWVNFDPARFWPNPLLAWPNPARPIASSNDKGHFVNYYNLLTRAGFVKFIPIDKSRIFQVYTH